MRHLFLFGGVLTLLILLGYSCSTEKEATIESPQTFFMEKKLSFFDPYELTYIEGKYQGYTYETWLRKPENLRMIHETFKKLGYAQLISEYDLSSDPCLLWGYVNRPLNQIIDSLIITYPFDTIESKYYREFWQRRRTEHNDQVVFEILNEVYQELIHRKEVKFDTSLVNDTLYRLVAIQNLRDHPTEEQALEDFEYLKLIGMHGSAYHLLFERYSYQSLSWDRESLQSELRSDTLQCCPTFWIKDNTK